MKSENNKEFIYNSNLSFNINKNGITHKLIIGDNYDSLSYLKINYTEKIDIIYIDPPYGRDKAGKWAKTNYKNDFSREDLLIMLKPRLFLAKQLLSDTGIIFCSIDDRNHAYVKILFDEIFEEKNFIGNFMWYKSATPSNLSKKIKKNLEFILCYQKKKNNINFRGYKTSSKSTDLATRHNNSKKIWTFPPKSLIWKYEDKVIETGIYGTTKYPNFLKNTLIIENGTNKNEVSFESNFIWKQSTLIENLKDVDMFLSKSLVLSYKRHKYKISAPSNLIDRSVAVSTTEEAGIYLNSIMGKKMFDYPKPVNLIQYLINFLDKKDAIILDFFAGSGTTGEAVLNLNREDLSNRQFILCTNNEITKYTPNGIAYDVTAERLKRIMTGKDYNGDMNFDWIKTNKSYGDNLEVIEIKNSL